MDSRSVSLVLKALDGLALRAAATAQNIASAGDPAYRPVKVSFEAALADAAAGTVSDIKRIQPRLEATPTGSGESVRLDLEMATASSTALRYGGLVETLDRLTQLSLSAIRAGR